MPRVSRRPVDKKLDQELKENFTSLISNLKASTDVEGFFANFLSKEEKIMLGKRLVLHLMLENDYKTTQIESLLRMSRETVRIHRLIWQNGDMVYRGVLRKIVKQQKTTDFFKKLDFLLKPLGLAMRARNDMRARAKLASGDFS